MKLATTAAALLASGWCAAQQAADAELTRWVVDPPFEAVGHRCMDGGGGRSGALLVFGRHGEIAVWTPPAAEGAESDESRGKLSIAAKLPHPERTLVDLARYGDQRFVVVAAPDGVSAYEVDSAGALSAEPKAWIPRARFSLRVLAPQLTGMVQDVNRDGAPDIVLPAPQTCELWLARIGAESGAPTFRKAATVAVETSRWGSRDGEFLSDELESSFAIPNLDTRDVNGDGRPDLLVQQDQRRAFHLQREDGSFSAAPDVQVDLSIFRDTTQKGSFQLGGVLNANDEASWSSRDLDGDGVPDYVIGHRRKVWVFRGGAQGPQFTEPSAILKTAEDITVLSVIELDADDAPDLLLVKVQIPTLATLLRGLFGEWDVRVGALGYRNKGSATFETSPKWSNELTVRLPGIVGLAKNPEKVLDRFTQLDKSFRLSVRGDLDGDGALDVLLASEDGTRLDAWVGVPTSEADARGERKLREILFDDRNTTWDIDRVVAALGNLAQRQVATLTGGRTPSWSVELREKGALELAVMNCCDFDGDGRDEIVVGYRRAANQRMAVLEVLRRR